MNVIHYTTFESDEAFSDWQLEKPRRIHNISPIIKTIDMELETQQSKMNSGQEDTTAQAKTNVGVFVTYFEEVYGDKDED